MIVPAYCRSSSGRVYRVVRSSHLVGADRVRFVLRAQAINATDRAGDVEVWRELDTELILDKVANNQFVPTPETTFEALWSQLKLDLDAREDT
jgi:hypothetical protein